MKKNYQHTMIACYFGFITQAIVNSYVPLLFLTFQREYGVTLERLASIASINFAIQLVVDFIAARFADRIGHRRVMVAAHLLAALGLVGLAVLPGCFADPYYGILLSVFLYAVGGGLIEVLVSPIAEACPTEKKDAQMSLLHSFYCWGVVGVVLLSTVFFQLFGIRHWRLLACIWALVPLYNLVQFLVVPLNRVVEDGRGMRMGELFRTRVFWLMALLMVASGASEQGMSQWASAFAESALGVSKTVGDLMGPCMFSITMGIARTIYARSSYRLPLKRFMAFSAVLCVACYLMASLGGLPVFGLIGCGLCGLSVGIFWPGMLSIASATCPRGGTAMFALLALAGDLGCSSGPGLVGLVSGAQGGNLKAGLLAGVVFPIIMLLGLPLLGRRESKRQ